VAKETGNTLSPDDRVPNRVLNSIPDYRRIQASVLPTFDPGVTGLLWNNGGTIVTSAGAAAMPTSAFVLTDVPNGRLFQRAAGATVGPVSLSGTYSGGDPTAIEIQVLKKADNTVVKDWTAASSAAIAGGSWAATVTGVPQGGSYYVKARPANVPSLAQTGTNGCFVGIMIVIYGQSNAGGLAGTADGSIPATAANVTYYNVNGTWSAPPGNGSRTLCNSVASQTGVPTAAMCGAVAGVALSYLMAGHGEGYFEAMAAQIQAVGGAEMIVWQHGEGDAAGAGGGIPTYIANQSTLHSQLCAAAGRTKAQMPFVIGGMGNADVSGTDDFWDQMQRKLMDCATTNPSTYYSHSNMDVVRLTGDGYHYDAPSQGRNGARFAKTVGTVLGVSTGYPRSQIVSAATVDATTTRVTIAHALGTDFAPTTGIKGFDVSGDNGATWAAATGARVNATTIDLTHASVTTSTGRLIRYLYGMRPDVSAMVKDNSALNAPMIVSAGPITPAPLASLPVPTFRSVGSANAAVSTAQTLTAISIGNAASRRMIMMGISSNGGALPTSIVFTPNVGTAKTATIAANTVTTGPRPQVAYAVLDADADTATTVNVVINYGSNPFSTAYTTIWTVPSGDLLSTTPVDVKYLFDGTGTATTLSVSPKTTTGGFVIAVTATDQLTQTIKTITSPNEAFAIRANAGASGAQNLSADASGLNGQTADPITVTWSNAGKIGLIAVSWR
jgi:hypothetical protein